MRVTDLSQKPHVYEDIFLYRLPVTCYQHSSPSSPDVHIIKINALLDLVSPRQTAIYVMCSSDHDISELRHGAAESVFWLV